MQFGVIVFPGSNCDHDCYHILKHVLDQEVRYIWHKESSLGDLDIVILPGGFSYGDYLRTGAIARFSPIMEDVIRFAHKGGIVLGICNGYQILCEAGLLPGVLLRNAHLNFISKHVYIRIENKETAFTHAAKKHILKIPVAHGEGNYFADQKTVQQLNENKQILFRYSTSKGEASEKTNPNGSIDNIAGIMNKQGNVMGLMPHPERAGEPILGSNDGLYIFESLIHSQS